MRCTFDGVQFETRNRKKTKGKIEVRGNESEAEDTTQENMDFRHVRHLQVKAPEEDDSSS